MKSINETTKTYRLFEALKKGQRLTAAEITKKFNIKNPRAEVTRIRQGGFAVYANREVAGNGREVTRYELGQPSKSMVALAYKARQLGIRV